MVFRPSVLRLILATPYTRYALYSLRLILATPYTRYAYSFRLIKEPTVVWFYRYREMSNISKNEDGMHRDDDCRIQIKK